MLTFLQNSGTGLKKSFWCQTKTQIWGFVCSFCSGHIAFWSCKESEGRSRKGFCQRSDSLCSYNEAYFGAGTKLTVLGKKPCSSSAPQLFLWLSIDKNQMFFKDQGRNWSSVLVEEGKKHHLVLKRSKRSSVLRVVSWRGRRLKTFGSMPRRLISSVLLITVKHCELPEWSSLRSWNQTDGFRWELSEQTEKTQKNSPIFDGRKEFLIKSF